MLSPTVDLATGKDKVFFYLDTSKLLDKQTVTQLWREENLFIPAQLVGLENSEAKLVVNGDVLRVQSDGLVQVSSQDKEGLADILSLDNFSEQSLLHTLRVRFFKVF
jgi:hypothetical protein